MKVITEYLDYRELLRDFFEDRKSQYSFYSYRMLGQRLEMDASQAFRVLKGELLLPERCIPLCISLLGLDEKQAEYFELLVHFSRVRSEREKKVLFAKIQDFRETPELILSHKQFRFFAEWYVSAIRALLGCTSIGEEWELIASSITPKITAQQAKEAIKLLLDLELIEMKNGVYELTQRHVSTGREVSSQAVRSYHHEMLRLADESLERHQKTEREIGTLTMAMDLNAYKDVIEIMAECRRQIRKRIDEIDNPDRVMQLNMNLFPLAYARKT